MVLWMLLEYVCSPETLLTHAVGGGLAYGLLAQQVFQPKDLIKYLLLCELAAFLLWLAIPGGWAAILTIAAGLYGYERLTAPQIQVQRDATFIADEDLNETVLKGSKLTKVTSNKVSTSKYKLTSDLRYIVYHKSKLFKCVQQERGEIDVQEISHISEGCYKDVDLHATRRGFQPERCFNLVLGSEDETISLIARSKEERDEWVSALRTLFRRLYEQRQRAWLESTYKKSDKDGSGVLSFDEVVDLLNQGKRSTDKAYIREIFTIFSEKSSSKTSAGDNGLTMDMFGKFYDVAGKRTYINDVFNKLLAKNEQVLPFPRFHRFLKEEQKDDISEQLCHRWIKESEEICPFYNISMTGFTNFLLSEEQNIFNRAHRKVYQDMSQPLSHYFIATSHNTYLTKDQLKGKSSVDAYISAFKRGCKCVELDCWDGPNDDPIIYHGHTLTSKILFKDVIQAINDYAFCVSDYPVILSFENHCSVEQQRKMAQYLVDILGNKLLKDGIPENITELPSPNDLRGKIICKAKKLKEGSADSSDEPDEEYSDDEMEEEVEEDQNSNKSIPTSPSSPTSPNGEKKGIIKSFLSSKKSSSKKKEKLPKIAQELSDLVVICRAVGFQNFEHSKQKQQCYEMSSFGEKKAVKFAKEEGATYVEYTRRQLNRIYPAGSRVDSSNYDPVPMWNVGSQLVALNYQTPCRAMQLNQAMFAVNGGCGYVLKPEFLRTDNSKFEPQGPFNDNDGVKMTIKVISGSQMPYSKESALKNERSLAVQVRISGVEADNKKERTRAVKNNGYSPTWNDELKFQVRVPQLAMVAITVKDGDNFLAGHTLPFSSIQQGYRVVPLMTKASDPLPFASIFVHVTISDNKPNGVV